MQCQKIKQKTLRMDAKMIGSKIAKARKEINISQAELAQHLFISPQAVGKWERGESIPDIVTINRLAKILGVDLNYFSADTAPADSGTASKISSDSIEQTAQEVNNLALSPEEQALPMNFSGSDLPKSDFAGVTAHKGDFKGSALRASSFAGADLTGSSFAGSDLREANFDGANLTDCNLSGIDLKNASFNESILVRTNFSASGMDGVTFTGITLTDVKLTSTDLRKTVFDNCIFDGVDFRHSDLRGLCLDGQTFINVKFEGTTLNEVTFRDAILKNVSFRSAHMSKKKAMCFDGATMDKLTQVVLKGLGADLSKVTII
ncbi:pentapeptide repeat-containing protein [Spirosoma soli]|uniref:Pentapeptide repeat-containing protein n=1 Tax=Spirosoma soli TaxID=1770529 RepID=A0ABW5MAB0_9BACT